MKKVTPLALLALCLMCTSVLAQTTEPSDTIKKKQKRAKRGTLASDSLPSVLDRSLQIETADTIKSKKETSRSKYYRV